MSEGLSIGFLELTGCSTCLENVLLHEKLSGILGGLGSVKYWPSHGYTVEPDSLDVLFVSGAVRTRAQVEKLKKLRGKTRILVAYGTCSIYGGLIGLTALINASSRGEGFLETIKTVPDIVEPDILVTGCPPTRDQLDELAGVINDYLENEKPRGKVFIGNRNSLCRDCPRKPRDPSRLEMPGIKRDHELVGDDGRCFLEQGILCLGPVTSSGCGHLCILRGRPCMGCNGPARGVVDQGLNYISSIGSILLKSMERIRMFDYFAAEIDRLVDPMGYLYRYTLPKSLLTKLALKKRGVSEK